MKVSEFKDCIHDTLLPLGYNDQTAEKLLLGTALHESGGLQYVKQVNGPALGFFQMEPATLRDLLNNWLAYRPDKKKFLANHTNLGQSLENNLRMNIPFQILAARFQYMRFKERIPSTVEGQARYWKEYWNTHKGKGTTEQYIQAWYGHHLTAER